MRYVSQAVDWTDRYLACEAAGMSAAQIAVEFGVSSRTVQRWRRRMGKSQGDVKVRLPDEVRERAARLIGEGCSLAEAARTVGAHVTTVRKWFPDAPRWDRRTVGLYAQEVSRFNKLEREGKAA